MERKVITSAEWRRKGRDDDFEELHFSGGTLIVPPGEPTAEVVLFVEGEHHPRSIHEWGEEGREIELRFQLEGRSRKEVVVGKASLTPPFEHESNRLEMKVPARDVSADVTKKQ